MKHKKQLSLALTLIMICSLFFGSILTANAAEEPECVDGSYLVNADSSEVTVGSKTRGIYLKSGSSTLTKEAAGKLTAGGNTVGQVVVSKIIVNVNIQKLVNGSWQYYDSWTATNYNSAYVSSSKTKYVPTGYYYRVCCNHSANSDVSGSFTNGLYI